MTTGALAAPSYEPEAACSYVGPDVMFPDDEHDPDNEDVQAAREVCLSCPIREACLSNALTRRELFGVWGGLTTPEREALRRRQYPRGGKRRKKRALRSTVPQHTPVGTWEDATLPFAV